MTFVDLDSIHRPSVGTDAPAAWGDGINDNCNYLYSPDQFVVYLASAQPVTNAAATTVAFDTVLEDTAAGWSASTHKYTIPTAGLWMFNATMNWAANTTGTRGVAIAATTLGIAPFIFVQASADPASAGRATTSMLQILDAGETMFVQAFQSSGGSLNTATGRGAVCFSGVRVG